MTNLEKVILGFDGKRDSILLEYIKGSKLLTPKEYKIMDKVWKESSRYEFWNVKDINIGKRNAIQYLKDNYLFCDQVNDIIAKAISYEWL